jgi:prephenate dehydrogenase
LFEGARVFLCPAPSTAADAVRLAEVFWRDLSADTELLDAGVHDDAMAWRSHLPQFASSALAAVLREAMIPRSELGAGGRDMTRLAGSSTSMWRAIAADNSPAIVAALSAFEDRLHVLREAIAGGDSVAITGILESARDWFDGEPTRPLTPSGVRA